MFTMSSFSCSRKDSYKFPSGLACSISVITCSALHVFVNRCLARDLLLPVKFNYMYERFIYDKVVIDIKSLNHCLKSWK